MKLLFCEYVLIFATNWIFNFFYKDFVVKKRNGKKRRIEKICKTSGIIESTEVILYELRIRIKRVCRCEWVIMKLLIIDRIYECDWYCLVRVESQYKCSMAMCEIVNGWN